MITSRRKFLISGAALASGMFAKNAISQAIATTANLQRLGFDRLDTLVEQTVSSFQSPGMALVIWKNGKEVHSRYAGFANLETRSPVTEASVFRIGSLTKQFAAALILKLVDAGKMSLADPVHQYLPFLTKHDPFTILELLNHTAGVRDGDDSTVGVPTHSQIEQAERIAQQAPFFDFPPGTAWLYSNANYILIGAIVEKVAGTSLADAASSLLFQPLNLHDTAFDNPTDMVVGRASGYTLTGKPTSPFQNADYLDVSLAGAAGAMRSTASDLCRWHRALFGSEGLPLSFAKRMTLPGRLRNGKLSGTNRFSENDKPMGNTQYGLGLMLDNATLDRSLIANHHGGINGFAAYLASHPSSGLTYACLCNVDTHPGLPFRDIRRQVFADILKANKA
ncbi:MAG: serine hydrolase domain-containing protein [Tahibacter sp.]